MADTKISALTAVTTPAPTDQFAINQGGTSKMETMTQIGILMPFLGVYAPGSFTIPTGGFGQMVQHLILTTTQRATLVGTARLRVD